MTVPVLVVSSHEQDHSLHRILEPDCRLRWATSRQAALSIMRRFRPSVVISDEVLTDGDWRELLADLQREKHGPPLIVSSRLADDRLWVEVLNLGGYDLLMKPFAATEVTRVVKMAAHRSTGKVGQASAF